MTLKSLLGLVLVASCLSQFSLADEVRVVVKKKQTSLPPLLKQKLSASSGYSTLTVANMDVVNELRGSGDYDSVELDYMVYIPEQAPNAKKSSDLLSQKSSPVFSASILSTDYSAPNDPEFKFQNYWTSIFYDAATGITSRSTGSNNILEAYLKLKPKVKPRVAVVDSSFGVDPDVVYQQGYSLSTVYNRKRTPNFTTADDMLALTGSAHGLSVAAIIGATTNNSYGMSGIADVDIIAAESMYGGNGYGSDTADAITWVAGGHVSDVPDIDKPVDVINLSLSGKVATGCPTYTQTAIDFAVSKGIVLVVAAGNNGEDISQYSPANCNNVIVVGAVQNNNQKASYSNTGKAVDLMALGRGVYSLGIDHKYFYWDGTSQATPIVAGAVALAKSEYPFIVQEEVELLLKKTTAKASDLADAPENSCAGDNCGAGILDASLFIDAVRDYMSSSKHYIKHVLNDGDNCNASVYKDYFGSSLRLCEMYEITFDIDAAANTDATYQLFSVPAGKAFYLANASSFVSGATLIDPTSQYGYLVCSNGQCGSVLNRLNSENAKKPVGCL
jgi:hypothetical protein